MHNRAHVYHGSLKATRRLYRCLSSKTMCTHGQNRKPLRTLVPFEQIHSAVQGLAMRADKVAAATPALGAGA